MARQLRIEFPGACYHVINRGVERRTIFSDAQEFKVFLRLLGELRVSRSISVHAYCLMPNHYHLVIQTPEAGLKGFMQDLNSRYARWFNDRHERVGPLFQGRYKAILVASDQRVIALTRYVHRNPVVAGLSRVVGDWTWSSAAAYLGNVPVPVWLETRLVQSIHGDSQSSALMRMKREWGRAGDEERDWMEAAVARTAAIDEPTLKALQRSSIPVRPDGSISGLRELRRPPEEICAALSRRISRLGASPRLARQLLAYALRSTTPLSESEIAKLAGFSSGMAVAQAIHRLRQRRLGDERMASLLGRLEGQLRGASMSNVKL